MKLLVVEDSPQIMKIYRRLCPLGFEFLGAYTQDEARDLVAAHPDIDMIIMDGNVPGEPPTTLNLIREIRAGGYTGELIAASNMPGLNDEMIAAGCSGKIDKLKLGSELPALFP